MPSLEIVCINQAEPSDFSRLPFRVEAEKELISHRSPKPLFQADFDQLKGCIYHLLDGRLVTAFDLLVRDWFREDENDEEDFNVEFRPEYAPLVKEMLEQLLGASPVRQVLFTTDYQYAPNGPEKRGPMPLREFWELHDLGKVRMNTSYLITQ